jgi:hypothetical protein
MYTTCKDNDTLGLDLLEHIVRSPFVAPWHIPQNSKPAINTLNTTFGV